VSKECPVVAVFGYNNVRIYDVMKIKKIVFSLYGANLLLCKKGITNADWQAVDYCCDVKLGETLESNKIEFNKIKKYCEEENVCIIGILPFSDKGVILGAYVGMQLGLPHDDYDTALVCLDKYEFRKSELEYDKLPKQYLKPSFTLIKGKEDLLSFYKYIGGNIILKPTSEGNSRGCVVITHPDHIQSAVQEVDKYFEQGVIAEECINYTQEYSYDQVAGVAWLTEKQTTQKPYCAEIQQIVPAPLSKENYNDYLEIGSTMANISGSLGGAAHNEFFVTEDGDFYAVEPNRRPAGDRIWDLAGLAFKYFSPWEAWIKWAVTREYQSGILQNQCSVGLRRITPSKNGVIVNIDSHKLKSIRSDKFSGIEELVVSKHVGDLVTYTPKDNSQFLGYIIARRIDANVLKELLIKKCEEIQKCFEIKQID